MTNQKWLRLCREYTAKLEALLAELVTLEANWPASRQAADPIGYARLLKRIERQRREMVRHLELRPAALGSHPSGVDR